MIKTIIIKVEIIYITMSLKILKIVIIVRNRNIKLIKGRKRGGGF